MISSIAKASALTLASRVASARSRVLSSRSCSPWRWARLRWMPRLIIRLL